MCTEDNLIGAATYLASFVPGMAPTAPGVELVGGAVLSTVGLLLDGAGDRALVTTGDYASDASFSVSFWFAKTECNTVATWWEYLYSHNEQPISILDASNDNVNMYMGCDNGMGGDGNQMGGAAAMWTDGNDNGVSGSFIRTVMIDSAGTTGLIDLNLHAFGEHGTITDRWNHVVLRVSTTTMSHVIDGTPTTDASYAVFIHHDYANSDASTFWPSPTTALATAFTGFSLADTAIIGAVDNSDTAFADARHFHGDFVGLTIFGDTISDSMAQCLFGWSADLVPDRSNDAYTNVLLNPDLTGPVLDNTIPGWVTTAATLAIVSKDGRDGVLEVADAGSFSAVSQTITTVPGTTYFVTFEVWAEPLSNTAGQEYCSSTDSNGLLDIHEGVEAVDRHGEFRICPIENEPGTWQQAEGLYTATAATTTFALHSESGWAAYFDSVYIMEAPDVSGGFSYLGCFVDSSDRQIDLDDGSVVASAVSTNVADAELECATACADYPYFGLQWVNECFCGNRYDGGDGPDDNDGDTGCGDDTSVNTLCANGQGNCGWRNAVYQIGGDTGGGDTGGGDGGGDGDTNCVGDVCGTVTQVSTDSDAGTTYQIGVTLSGDASNVYTIYGTDASPLSIPASYQEAAPFGTNTGGVAPGFVAVIATAAYDGWLTVGITDGDSSGALGSVGLDWATWTQSAALESANGAVFYMNPDDGPAGSAVLAQFTTAPGWSASLGAQGRSASGAADWMADGLTFSG